MSEPHAWEIPILEFETGDPPGPHGAQPGTELTDTEVIRVLEARPRFHEPDEVAVARPVVRELVPPTRRVEIPAPKPAPVAKPLSVEKAAPAPKHREERDTLADTLNELRKFAFDLESDDTGSTTGVRHLEVELTESAASRKSKGPRR